MGSRLRGLAGYYDLIQSICPPCVVIGPLKLVMKSQQLELKKRRVCPIDVFSSPSKMSCSNWKKRSIWKRIGLLYQNIFFSPFYFRQKVINFSLHLSFVDAIRPPLVDAERRWRTEHHTDDSTQSRSTWIRRRTSLPLRLERRFTLLHQVVQGLTRYLYLVFYRSDVLPRLVCTDNTEFFGYVPKETPQFRVFPWSNFSIHVSLNKNLFFNYYFIFIF